MNTKARENHKHGREIDIKKLESARKSFLGSLHVDNLDHASLVKVTTLWLTKLLRHVTREKESIVTRLEVLT